MIPYVLGDTKPDLNFLIDDGTPNQLPDGTVVKFRLKTPSGGVVEKVLAIAQNTASAKRAVGSFLAGDVVESGAMLGELVLEFPDGTKQHGEEPIDVYVRPEFVEAQL